jgi:hypothetical protein
VTIMRFTGFKTKDFFTLGIYVFVWHSRVVAWLRDEFNFTVDGQSTWRLFVPFYNLIVWWQFLSLIRDIERTTFGAADFRRGGNPLSVGRAFFWSSMWFHGGPYINRHLNALDAYRRGQTMGAATASPPIQLPAALASIAPR